MATKARAGAGAKLQYGNGASPEVFTTIAEILTMKHAGQKIDLIDVTNQDSAVQNGLLFREKITGLADGGDIDFTGNNLPGNTAQEAYRALFDGNRHNFRIVPPLLTGQTVTGHWDFAGYIIVDEHDFPIDKQMTFTGKITITGPTTFTLPS